MPVGIICYFITEVKRNFTAGTEIEILRKIILTY